MIALGSDHAGFALKQEIKEHLEKANIKYTDYGTFDENSCDYPDFAEKACAAVTGGECKSGILVCGTGVGMSIAANKIKGIRAACCSDYFSAKYTREHNDANILCLGGRVVGSGLACELVDVFLNTPFCNGENHIRRISKIASLESKR
jgi:ribose 5-phosphate isomerase B